MLDIKTLNKAIAQVRQILNTLEQAAYSPDGHPNLAHPKQPKQTPTTTHSHTAQSRPLKKRSLVREILQGQSMDVYQIVDALKARGYVFVARNPASATRTMLYRYPAEFGCDGGLFYLL